MRVLVVEDEPVLAQAIHDGLRLQGIASDVVHSGEAALVSLDLTAYDAMVLDRDLPGVHGDEVCDITNRTHPECRVIMLTAARRLDDKVSGFALGADDYLTKPFDLVELAVRLQALARRAPDARPAILAFVDITLDPFRREVTRRGRHVPLSRKEFAVLEQLMRAEGGVISAEELLERAWDENADPFTHTVRVTISNLRRRLGEPWVIHTLPGVGYRMGPPEE